MPTSALLDERRLEALLSQWSRDCGRRLQKRRKQLNWRQDQLADLAGVSATSVSKFELGQATPKDATRVALACALCCEVDEIWPPLDRSQVMNIAQVAA